MPQNIIEPNNFFNDEFCCGANYTEAWNTSWGWSDFKCSRPSTYMCRVTRESGGAQLGGPGDCQQPGPCQAACQAAQCTVFHRYTGLMFHPLDCIWYS
jgi:hypothetical protein